jgi:LysR family transcriptional regulator, transcriptional activator for dmlA
MIDDLRIFERVAARENFASAARDLNMSPTAVTRAIARLEERLGVRLMTRTTRVTRLTQDGQTFFDRCSTILSAIDQAEEEMRSRGSAPTGTLRVSAPISFGRRHVAPIVSAFQREYPSLAVQLFLSDSSDDLRLRECDLALRVGPPVRGDYITRRLLQARRAVCASPQYLAQAGRPQHPYDLQNHRGLVLVRDEQLTDHWMFEFDGAMETVRVPATLASNSGEVIHQWVLEGNGIACKSLWDIEEDLATGRLVELLGDHSRDAADMFLIYSDRRNLPNRARLFIDYLTDDLARFETRLTKRLACSES